MHDTTEVMSARAQVRVCGSGRFGDRCAAAPAPNDWAWRAVREGVLALYRAHAEGRQMPLPHARRVVRGAWHEWDDFGDEKAPREAKIDAIDAFERFYLRHQPFRTDRTLYVQATGGLCDRAVRREAWPVDRVARSSLDWTLHVYGPPGAQAAHASRATSRANGVELMPAQRGRVVLVVHDVLAGTKQAVEILSRAASGPDPP